jgi:DNA topoisomerase-1
MQSGGAALPPHIEKLKLPPAWTDVRYSEDPNADLLAIGKDSKGRVQSVYSERFTSAQAAAKFARIEELRTKFGYVSKQNEQAQQSTDRKIKDSADCLSMIMKMGIRPGSEDDTGAKVKAYGATTLEGRHVVETSSGVSLRFVGKKGVSLDLPVDDPDLAVMLTRRAKASGANGKLFPATTDKALLEHTHSLNGGGFKTKDFRTHVGTATAYSLVKEMPKPTSMAEYKKRVMDVAKQVSKKLGNTPVIALQSYISPAVFAEWRIAA